MAVLVLYHKLRMVKAKKWIMTYKHFWNGYILKRTLSELER